jgi:hypothetical protein
VRLGPKLDEAHRAKHASCVGTVDYYAAVPANLNLDDQALICSISLLDFATQCLPKEVPPVAGRVVR